jgi:hypothetical protein
MLLTRLAIDYNPPISAFQEAGVTGVCHYTQLVFLKWSHLGWSPIVILLSLPHK